MERVFELEPREETYRVASIVEFVFEEALCLYAQGVLVCNNAHVLLSRNGAYVVIGNMKSKEERLKGVCILIRR